MKFIPQSIPDVLLIELIVHRDERGYLVETFRQDMLDQILGYKVNFIQDNESKSISRGILRGLHYQSPPYTQSKLVRVIKGKVLDVAVDLRKKSHTFGKYVAVKISHKDDFSFYIPEGFAHGFLCLSKECTVNYKCSQYRNELSEKTLAWDDKDVNINWPIKKPILSDKDKKLALHLKDFQI